MKIWANTIVHNEENFIWFAIMSVVDYVDKVLVWDTGSTDKTVKIIQEIRKIKKEKIIFKEVGEVDKNEFSKMRQGMLDQSKCDWILVLDGDEIWPDISIKNVAKEIEKQKDTADAIVVPFYNLVGDIYHYQKKDAGKYKISGKIGHFTVKAINRSIPGLHLEGPYGVEGYLDKDNVYIQHRDPKRTVFLDAPFLHCTHLKRSSKNGHNKYKYELGISLPKDFRFPKVFYKDYPSSIPSPWVKTSGINKIIAGGLTPLRKIKRRIV